jgi:hypothetical protein
LSETFVDWTSIEKKVSRNTHKEIAPKNCPVNDGKFCPNIKNNERQKIQIIGVITLGENILFFETFKVKTNNNISDMSKNINTLFFVFII